MHIYGIAFSSLQNALMQQPLAHLYFLTVLEQLQTKAYSMRVNFLIRRASKYSEVSWNYSVLQTSIDLSYRMCTCVRLTISILSIKLFHTNCNHTFSFNHILLCFSNVPVVKLQTQCCGSLRNRQSFKFWSSNWYLSSTPRIQKRFRMWVKDYMGRL